MFASRYSDITPYTFFCVAAYLQGAILFGLDTGSFGSIQALPSWLRQFGTRTGSGAYTLDPTRRAIMNSLPWIGKLSGCFTAEQVIEKIGYRKTALVANLIQIVGVVLEMTATHWAQFTIGRVVTYYAVGLCENMVPSYNAEIAPARHRGLLAGSIMTFTGLGNLWGAGMGEAFKTETRKQGWLIPVAMQFIPALLMIVLVPFTPESPRWLIQKGKHDLAQANMNKLRRKEDVQSGAAQAEFDTIAALVVDSQTREQARWGDLFKGNYLKRIWIVCTLFIISQMNGNQFVQSYAPTFYKQQGLGDKSFLYNLLGQVVGFVGCFMGLIALDITGRRPCFIYGSAVVTFLLFLAAGLGLSTERNHARAMTIVSCFIVLKAFSRISATNCAFLTGAEIGGIRMRRKIMALGTSSDVIAAFLVTFVTPYIMPALGVNIAWIFGAVAGFGCVWGYFFFPELKGRTLEEVDEMFSKGLWAFQFKGYTTEAEVARLRQVETHAALNEKDYQDVEHKDAKV